jgi:hypothetical protein
MTDPVETLSAVVNIAKEGLELSHLLGQVRKITELDKDTLKRLMRERAAVVEMFRANNIRNEAFDHDYKDNFLECLSKLRARVK